MPPSQVSAIVGLANPGAKYADTRHNAGAWFIDLLTRRAGIPLRPERKFLGDYAKLNLDGHELHLLVPATYMNRSGQAVSLLAKFYKLAPEALLIAHDELDIPPGQSRFKQGGGHGGHNGLRDIISALGNARDFHRLRIGIGHPGDATKVVDYVLGLPGKAERRAIDESIDAALDALPYALSGDWAKAMNRLHASKF
ncbi:aminoacyl-tRNA hydrolase [Halotalea alkalilenta]|uniref:Peptidyl-tRNA hydrolase n=1 Tax=Halotalea alkalilenta TaxID=376489 RepID=A0A172YDY0_9GAMM|nr:aminoacyl-tRNA hydrolase [Halotalea alkalilenta]ANF57468.1 aminoacyl-tRNA hydrolase [Halotalea alkalilenta]